MKKPNKKKNRVEIEIDGEKVVVESNFPIAEKEHDCGPVPNVKFKPTKEVGEWKVKRHTREEARAFFSKINRHE